MARTPKVVWSVNSTIECSSSHGSEDQDGTRPEDPSPIARRSISAGLTGGKCLISFHLTSHTHTPPARPHTHRDEGPPVLPVRSSGLFFGWPCPPPPPGANWYFFSPTPLKERDCSRLSAMSKRSFVSLPWSVEQNSCQEDSLPWRQGKACSTGNGFEDPYNTRKCSHCPIMEPRAAAAEGDCRGRSSSKVRGASDAW